MELMARRLYFFYRPDEMCPDEVRWVKQLRKCFKVLKLVDKQRAKEPKFSQIPGLTQLSDYLQAIFVRAFLLSFE